MPVERTAESLAFFVEYRSTTRMTSQNLQLDLRSMLRSFCEGVLGCGEVDYQCVSEPSGRLKMF